MRTDRAASGGSPRERVGRRRAAARWALARFTLAAAALASCAPTPGRAPSPAVSPAPPAPSPAPGAPSAPAPDEPSRALAVGGVVRGAEASVFELVAPPGEAPRVLAVEVDELVNPRGEALVLVVTALLPAAPLELGRLSFFPANRAGTFAVPLPAAVRAHVQASGGLRLRCALENLENEAGHGLEGLEARVRSLRWMPEP